MIETSFVLKEGDYKKALLEANRKLAILSFKYNLPMTTKEQQILSALELLE